MNIYKQELKMQVKSIITWSLAVSAVIFIYLSLFPSISQETDLMNKAMESFPKELLIAFGLGDTDLSSIMGFYGMVFLFVQILLSIQASNYGFSLVSIEERELTADFLLVKPVRRSKILTNKFLAAFTSLTITNLIVWASTFILINAFKGNETIDTRPLLLLLSSIVIFQLFFLSVGVLISLMAKRIRSVTPYSMALAFGMYLVNAFGGMLGDETLEYISPFKHFEPNYIINHSAYNIPLAGVSVIVIILAIASSYVLYSKRDINAAV